MSAANNGFAIVGKFQDFEDYRSNGLDLVKRTFTPFTPYGLKVVLGPTAWQLSTLLYKQRAVILFTHSEKGKSSEAGSLELRGSMISFDEIVRRVSRPRQCAVPRKAVLNIRQRRCR